MPGKEVVLSRGREQDVRSITDMKAQRSKRLSRGGREREMRLEKQAEVR